MKIVREYTPNKYSGGNSCKAIVIHQWNDPKLKPTLQGTVNWFKNPANQVSAHYIVSGDTVVQMADETDICWHAREANAFAIGIEIDPNVPGNTYRTVAQLIQAIRKRRGNIPIQKHSQHVNTACPNFIDFNRIVREAGQVLGATSKQGNDDMTEQFIKQTYYAIDGRWPSQKEIDFHMAKSNPTSFVDGFKAPKWKQQQDTIASLNAKLKSLGSVQATAANLKKELDNLKALEVKEDILEAQKEEELITTRARVAELEAQLEMAYPQPGEAWPDVPVEQPKPQASWLTKLILAIMNWRRKRA